MDAGQFDRKITLQRATGADDGYSSEVASWADLATVSARLMPLTSAERAVAGQVTGFGKVTFQIRRDSSWADLGPKDRLTYGGTVYNIIGVREYERRFLMVDATRDDG